MTIELTNSGKVTIYLGDGTLTSSSALSLSTWTQVVARFAEVDPSTDPRGYVGMNFGNTAVIGNQFLSTTLLSTDFASTDIIRVGGFIGYISDLRIFSPTAQIINNRKPYSL